MNPFHDNSLILLLVLFLWAIPWKIYAVWLAVKHNHKQWFVALIILNTVGILEIFYVFRIAKKSWTEVKEDFNKAWTSFK
jgi:hypothetical protein